MLRYIEIPAMVIYWLFLAILFGNGIYQATQGNWSYAAGQIVTGFILIGARFAFVRLWPYLCRLWAWVAG